ncbi:MAG: YcaO-like family protein [Nocardioides sp.]|nr:YcaO-like family protein [Nocardioides sp.]
MRITAVADDPGGALPASMTGDPLRATREMMAHVTAMYGPVLRASTFIGSGSSAGGAYAGHSELADMDGLLQDLFGQPSMEPGVNDTLFGGGKGFSFAGTSLSTVGEALERVVAGLVSTSTHMPSERRLGSWSDLTTDGFACLHPTQVTTFSEGQYATPHFLYERFAEDTVVQWIRGHRAISGEEVWVPAQLVDMVHIYDPGEAIIGYPVSGGLSCHISYRDAIYHGITEVVERDAVNVSWYTDAKPRIVDLDHVTRGCLGDFADRMELDHSACYLLEHSSDVCSAKTFSVVGLQDWLPRRKYCAGGGSDYSSIDAVHKAAAEYGQTRSTLALANVAPGSSVGRSVRTMFDWEEGRPLKEMTLFFQAIGYYGLPDNVPHLEHYMSGERVAGEELFSGDEEAARVEMPTAQKLDKLLAELQSSGIDPVILDYSHPDWQQLSVVKIYIPELTTPFLQSRPMLGHPRLHHVRDDIIRANGEVLPLPYP